MMQPTRGGGIHLVLAAGLALYCSHASFGGTYRDDVGLLPHVEKGDAIHLVGGVTSWDTFSFGTGVVIDPWWVLTAAHVVGTPNENSIIRFETDPDPSEPYDPNSDKWWELPLSGLFGVTQVAVHQYYDDVLGPAGGFDIALLKLDAPVQHYTPYQRVRIDTSVPNPDLTPEFGKAATAVGFGATGPGSQGFQIESGGLFRLAGDNTIDALATHASVVDEFVERNVIDPKTGQVVHLTKEQIASQFLLSDFDGPDNVDGYSLLGSDVPLDLEYSVAPGDSGGPLFIEVDGQLKVAGINSFIHGPEPDWGDGSDNASYGDLQGYLRVSAFNDWIDAILNGSPDVPLLPVSAAFKDPVFGETPEDLNLPEPATAFGLSLAAALLLRRRSRRAYNLPHGAGA